MTTLQDQIDALPGWPAATFPTRSIEAALARLALAREWIAETGHSGDCPAHLRGTPYGDDDAPCLCYRDVLLKAMEVPK